MRDRYVDLLLTHISDDHYPSGTMMDEIEKLLNRQQRDRYVRALCDKLANDRYPSPDLMRRISGLVGRM